MLREIAAIMSVQMFTKFITYIIVQVHTLKSRLLFEIKSKQKHKHILQTTRIFMPCARKEQAVFAHCSI